MAIGRWMHVALIICIIAIVVGLGIHGVGLGLGHDLDSRAIFENSVPAILRGSYVTGRSYGNPLYEYVAAWLYAAGGIILANSYSVVLAIGTILVFDRLLVGLDDLRRSLALIGFSLGPVFLTNSFCFGEWMQTFFFTVCLFWSCSRWLQDSRFRHLGLYALSSVLLVLSRPDAAFVCVCVWLATLWQMRLELTRSIQVTVASIIAGIATAAIFIVINGGTGFLHNLAFDNNDTWLRAFIIAVLGLCTIFGFVGIAILAGAAAWLVAKLWHGKDQELSFWSRALLIGLAIGFPRYVIFPQKLEYVFYLLILALLVVAHEKLRWIWSALLTASVVLPSLATISLFERSGASDHLFVRFHMGPSAIAQDWTTVKADWEVMDPKFLKLVAEQVYAAEPGPLPRVYSVNFGPGLQSDKGDLIIGDTEAYRLDNPRSGPSYARAVYRRIYICNKSVFHGSPGWRFLEQPVPRLEIDPATGKVNVACHREEDAGTAMSR
jgi:hypothetical protein